MDSKTRKEKETDEKHYTHPVRNGIQDKKRERKLMKNIIRK